jgi:pyruvate dehydrogenase E2 component (dihydrolipoamide acetyltransferase)
MTTFNLPDLGEGLEEAEIVAWHVSAGDRVVEGQPLVAVETDKAVVEIPSPQAGVVARLLAAVGAHVKVGGPLVAFADANSVDVGAIVGTLTPHDTSTGIARAVAPAAPTSAAPVVRAVPKARALARRLGVELPAVAPSGPGGVITEADVEAAAMSTAPVTADGEALRGPRRAMARNMARAHAAVAPATVHDDADVEGWAVADADVTARLIRAIVAGCQASPALNAWFDPEKMTVRRHSRVDVGIAVETEDGLFTPVLRDAASADSPGVRAAVERLKAAVGQRSLGHAELSGATIMLSNFGTLGGRHAVLVVSPPQVAILGAGRISARPVVRNGSIIARRVLPLSLTFDHRVVTGAEAARFLATMVADLEASG